MSQARDLIRSVFTDHLLAKFFAIVFAIITVYLIERELSDEIEFINDRVSVYLQSEVAEADPEGSYIVIQRDRGVWIDNPSLPKQVRVVIRGPKNRQQEFEQSPEILVRVRLEQVPSSGERVARKLTLVDADFESLVEDVSVRLVDSFEFLVDRIERADSVPVQVSRPAGIPFGRVFDEENSSVEPEGVDIIGPRSQLGLYGAAKPLPMTIESRGRSGPLEDGASYPLKLPSTLVARGLSLADQSAPRVTIALTYEKEAEIDLGSLPIHWSYLEDLRAALAARELELVPEGRERDVDVVLRGPPGLIERYGDEEKRKRLRDRLYVIADPSEGVLSYTGDNNELMDIELRVLGLPEGLKAELAPPKLFFVYRREDTEEK